MATASRAGLYVKQPTGYRAFIPAKMPPDPPVEMTAEIVLALSEADQALGALNGTATTLPNPDLFVAMYVRQEAVLSSQIEGTQSTLEDIIQFELDAKGQTLPKDTGEVVNYVGAMRYGIERLKDLPLSLRLIREIHGELLRGVRGSERAPGEFRRSQNWIGPEGCTLANATFVPPPVPEMNEALANFEDFLRNRGRMPVLIHCALAHAQFETIHPFLDGNGRVGRLLIAFLLYHEDVLRKPLLYLSHHLKLHRVEYYDRLTAIRSQGDWEGWVEFFLRGVREVSRKAAERALAIHRMREEYRATLKCDPVTLKALDYLFTQPIVNAEAIQQHVGCSYGKVYKTISFLVAGGLLRESTGQKRNRLFRFEPYLALFEQDTPPR